MLCMAKEEAVTCADASSEEVPPPCALASGLDNSVSISKNFL